MRKRLIPGVVTLAMIVNLSSAWAPSSAIAEGSASIASAPTITFGALETGTTATGAYLTFGCGPGRRSFWGLPVYSGDDVQLNWESAVPTTEMVVAPVGTTDANMAYSDNLVEQALEEGRNSFKFTAPETGTMPIWFRSCEDIGATPGAYSFTAEDQHAIEVVLQNRRHIHTKTVLKARAALADGAPVPDGLVFHLTGHWPHDKSTRFSAISSDGWLRFAVHLPRRTVRKIVAFTVSRPEDAQFLRALSPTLSVSVARRRHSGTTPTDCRRGFKKVRIHGRERCVKFQNS